MNRLARFGQWLKFVVGWTITIGVLGFLYVGKYHLARFVLHLAPAASADEPTPYQPVGTMPATLPGGTASLGYPPGRFTPVPDLTTASGVKPTTARWWKSWLPQDDITELAMTGEEPFFCS